MYIANIESVKINPACLNMFISTTELHGLLREKEKLHANDGEGRRERKTQTGRQGHKASQSLFEKF